ncbi:MAG: L-threonine 3-dehydrogenase [Candidatus Aenigmarchaeota archaeon]|nr:L-threonine 3-dehydrogenase [Candidatus Aenigmarchaeota archaeon]
MGIYSALPILHVRMKAIRKVKPGAGFEMVDVGVPKPEEGEVLVKVKATSMCGTDIHIYNWEAPWSEGRLVPPKTLGHEVCGEVVELGKGVKGLAAGDNVSAESHIYCGKCDLCRAGHGHICRRLQFFSVDTDGFWAEYAIMPEQNAWKNPEGMEPEIATLQESMGNSVYTVSESNVRGKDVAIFGLGSTGLFATGIAKAMGARKVIVVGGTKMHLDIAKKMKADVLVNRHDRDPLKEIMEETEGRGPDVVLEMSGSEQALQQAVQAVKPTGMVSALGLPTKQVTLDVSKNIILKDVTFRGIYGRRIWDTWKITSELLRDKKVDIRPVITHRLRLEDFEKGVQAMKSGESGKVVMFP